MHPVIADFTLLFVTFVWGVAFVAQREATRWLGPFTFNALRFALGALLVLVVAKLFIRPGREHQKPSLSGVILLGGLLFAGAGLQQGGIMFTTAGKAGFLTVLYVVLVPLISRFAGQRVFRSEVVGSLIAVAGGYLLSMTEELTIGKGDLLVLMGAVAWASHIVVISKVAARADPIAIAWQQFLVCSILSLLAALFLEEIVFENVQNSFLPILYAGGVSIAMGYTLQAVAQKHVSPSHAVIIFSLEGVFGALAGWFFLSETLSNRSLAGAALTVVGVLVAQYPRIARTDTEGGQGNER